MKITKRHVGPVCELAVTGRLDAHWADHLSRELTQVVRHGAHDLHLDLAAVEFISSAGLRVLLYHYKQLKALHGSLVVSAVSPAVQTVLALVGFEQLLGAGPQAARPSPSGDVSGPLDVVQQGNATFELYEHAPDAALACRAIGNPTLLDGLKFDEHQCQPVQFPTETFGLGLGAFGSSYHDCKGRFGEFLAAAGAVTYQPTDGTKMPDYQLQRGGFLPDVHVLYALKCHGRFSHFLRFEASEEGAVVPLTQLVQGCLTLTHCALSGFVVLAETASLVGAALKRSPTRDQGQTHLETVGAPLHYPAIRDWLSFTPEEAFPRSVALIVGVAATGEHARLAPFLRPLTSHGSPLGHFHAAAFPYRAFKKGTLGMASVVADLFDAEALQGLLHLVNDHRRVAGSGESALIRGACWTGPITEVSMEGDV